LAGVQPGPNGPKEVVWPLRCRYNRPHDHPEPNYRLKASDSKAQTDGRFAPFFVSGFIESQHRRNHVMPAITLPDGSQREFDRAVTVMDVAADIGDRNRTGSDGDHHGHIQLPYGPG